MGEKKRMALSVVHNGDVFESERFRSVCECVSIKFTVKVAKNTLFCARIIGFSDAGEEAVVLEKIREVEQGECFTYSFQFDPVSLAVYQNVTSFCLRVRTDGIESVKDCSWYEDTDLAGLLKEIEGRKNKKRTACEPHPLSKVLFVGNSLLLGMENRYGMCSSSPRNDYYHYVTEAILEKYPQCVFQKIHGASIEHSESVEAYEAAMFQNPNGYTKRPFAESLTPDLDLIFLQITDNVNTEKKVETFKQTADMLLREIRARSPKAKIIWVYGWYFKKDLFPFLWELFERYDVESVCLLSERRRENEAPEGLQYESEDGTKKTAAVNWLTHPGDKGMYVIAKKMIEAMKNLNML